ncbi:MAG: site-2 protease family protein [Calothrix sp. MO_192.B10]|nr:site-2 protease family protein [Calothrix sp. MO_192.B10]
MTSFLLILLLGLLTYLMVQRSVADMTRTPVWLLWLVLMMPVLVWSFWTAKHGSKLPPILVLAPLLVSSVTYWVLFQWGRKPTPTSNQQTAPSKPQSKSVTNPTAELLPSVRPLEAEEEKQLRNCFPWSVYYLQKIEYLPQAVICRGQLKTTSSDAYQRIKENIEGQFGDRFLLIFQEGFNDKPFFVLVPNSQATKESTRRSQEKLTRPGLAFALLVATLVTTTLVGARIAGVEQAMVKANPQAILQGLPYALGLMGILGVHELGHYLTARFYKIRSTLPYFIPMPFFLGTFGAFIQMRSPIPNRKSLFDVSIAGPIAGFLFTLPLLFWGLANSEIVPLPEQRGFLNPNALDPKYSFLLALAAKLVLGNELTSQSAIDLHPVGVAACLGLLVTALNLIPVGQLDGGHVVHAMFGQKTAIVIGQISRLLLLLLSIRQPGIFLWAIILLFIPLMDEPALNDVTELDNKRDTLGLIAMAILIAIVLPVPQAIARFLQL